MAFAFFDETVTGKLRGKEPRATVEAVRMGQEMMFASSAKAERDLGFKVLPIYNCPSLGHRLVYGAWVRACAMRIAIIAALPGELKPLVINWQRVRTRLAWDVKVGSYSRRIHLDRCVRRHGS